MSNNKVMKARLQMKCDVASNWDNAKDTFIPYKGEIIFTQETANGPITEMRIGDGVSTYGQLPVFTDNYDIDTTYDLAAAKSKSNGDVTIDLTAGGSGSGTDSVKIKGSGATTVTTDESGVITIDSTDTQQFTITANAEDDNVVILSGTSGINSVSYKAEHAKKGPNTTKGATADVTVDAAGESGTIKIPKVTVDEYGHTTGLTEQTLLIEIPNSIKNPNALSIGGKTYDGSSAVSITAADLGIDNALHFIGITTTAITDNATTNPIKVNGNNHTAVAGDVVLYNDNEYVFDGSKWLELGDGSSHALKTNTITAGKGLTDGGAIGNNPTINVGQGNGITVTDDAVAAKAGNGITVDSTGINHADTSSQSSIAADGRKYITGVTLDIYGHVTGLTTGTETVTDTNTAHSHSVGTGLKMTPITDAGGIDGDVKYEANLKSASSLGTIGSTSKLYAVGVDSNGNLAVNVPWTDTNTQDGNDNQTVTTGGVTFGANDPVEFVAGSNVTISGDASTKKITINSTDTNTWRKVQLNGVDKLGTGTNTKPLNIKAGNNVTITEENGTFTFSATGTNTDTGKTYTAKSDSLITIDDTEIGTKYITPGTADNSVEIFDGVANQQYSIAIGTNDKTALAAIVGSTAANSISTDVPTASGVGSLAMGGGAKAVTAGGQALGALNTSGVKGYYWHTINSNDKTITLSTTRPSTLNGSCNTPSGINWKKGDKVIIVNDNQYIGLVIAEDVGTNGKVKFESLPFTGSNYDSTFMGATVYPLDATYKPDDRTIAAFYQTNEASGNLKRWQCRSGTIDVSWASTVLGAANISSGTGSLVAGFNNWQAGNFGMTGGRNNIGGYCGVTTGFDNENYGNHSIVVGRDLINHGSYSSLFGRENTINNIPGADPSSHNNISGKGNVVSGHSNIVSGETNKAETTYQSSIFGSGHILNKANYVSVFGRGNGTTTPITGNYHFVTGTQNTVSGTMNTVFGGSYNYNGTDGNTVSGIGNIVGGSLNTASANFSLVHGASNISSHYYSYLLGRKLTSTNDYQFIIGTNNATAENAAFIIGSGAVNGTAKNALVVTKYGDITADGSINIKDSLSLTADSIVLGIDNNKSGYNNIILGSNNTANGECNIISGTENFVDYISTEFAGNTLLGYKNVTTGRYNVVNGTENENVSGSMSLINGSKNEVTGSKSLVNGSSNTVSGNNSITIGGRNEVTHNYGATIGYRVSSTSNCSLVIGQLNQTGKAFKNDRLIIANGFEATKTTPLEYRTLFTIPSNGYWDDNSFSGTAERYYYANAMKPSDGLTYGFLLHQLLGYQTDAENRRYALKMENSTDNTNNGTNGKYYLEANWVSGYTAAQKARNLYVDLPQASDKDYGVVKTGDIINIVETVLLDGAW